MGKLGALLAVGAAVVIAGLIAFSRTAKAATATTPTAPRPGPVPPPVRAATPASTPLPPSTGPSTVQSKPDDSDVYFTPPEYAVLSDPGGWVDFQGMQVTALPLTDSRTGLFARLKYDDAKAVAARLGAELLEEKDFAHIHEAAKTGEALEIVPVTLVATSADTLKMASLAFAKKHDQKVHEQLTAKGWSGSVPVSNVGKYWLEGGYNFGWYDKNATGRDVDGNPLIQSKGGMHIDSTGHNTHIDYSQVTMLKKASGSGWFGFLS
jgi:hypothetical protein